MDSMHTGLNQETQTQAGPEGPFGVYNGIDDLPVLPWTLETRLEAEAVLEEFKGRFQVQGYYLTAGGLRVSLCHLDADDEGGGVYIVSRGKDPEFFDENFDV